MTFYFYDLETSGLDPKWSRIMQFAGQRTDENLKPIGEPHNILVKLGDDVLPEPEAILLTKITPQATLQDGVTEAEFLETLQKEVFTADTTVLGYNSIRFDDEFMRYTLYRNFYDPYEREWADGRSRWDIVDAVRMMRALRPDGIEWPFSESGSPTNRLEKLTEANNLMHDAAHDALSDVLATIAVAKLMKKKQPKLFDHLLSMRDKRKVAQLVDPSSPKAIVHTSGMFGSDNLATSVVIPIAPHPTNSNAVLVYDLRHDPAQFADLDSDELARLLFTPWRELAKTDEKRLPVKAIHLNKSPAVAPLGVLDEGSQERIGLTIAQVEAHLSALKKLDGFGQRVNTAFKQDEFQELEDVDTQLYGGFINDADKKKMAQMRGKDATELADFDPGFSDDRLKAMVLRYKARNFPKSLNAQEQTLWNQYRKDRLNNGGGALTFQRYFNKLGELAQTHAKDADAMFILEELQLYGESIAPFENESLDLEEPEI